MPKPQQPQPTNPPPEKNTPALSNLVDKVVGKGESGTQSSLPTTLILIGVAVLIISVMGILLVLSKRKAARLAARVRKLEEEKAQREEDFKLIENEKDRAGARAAIQMAEARIFNLKKELEKLNAAGRARAAELASVTSWADLEVVEKRDP